ncbi:MAG: DNA-3-methyladenine glycosylase family protein [Nocardioides sp.]
MIAADACSIWGPGHALPFARMLWPLRRGPRDPTYRVDDSGRHWRGIRTPSGPATLVLEAVATDQVRAMGWGPGAEWAVASLPDLLGASDPIEGFDALVARQRDSLVGARVSQAWRQHRHARIGRTGLVMEALVPAVIEQKVTGQEAFAGFRSLVLRFGERAPGPGPNSGPNFGPNPGSGVGLWVQPTPETLARIPSWDWLKLHVDPARARAVVRAARVADALERLAGLPGDEADERLCSLPGIGRWTSAEIRQRALGDADAVSFGDYHVANQVGWAILGRDIDDAELAELLEPWRPHRGRVVSLILAAGYQRPRRGPRMAPRTHLPGRTPGSR